MVENSPISKEEVYNLLIEEIRSCRKCGLWESRRNPVPGDGDINANVVLIGEAPGYWEDVRGKPFVGAAGRLLDEIFKGVSLSRDEIYITNILKCRPPKNRDPRPEEIKACTPYLDRQLRLIKPNLIVTLGRHSTIYILSKAGVNVSGITAVRGRVYEINLWGSRVQVIPTFHPAAALYNVRLREYIEKDFRLVKERIGKV